jgi:hypothetical protein
MATEFTFERVERHLYRHRDLMRNGQWSVNYVAVFRDHTGKDRRIKLVFFRFKTIVKRFSSPEGFSTSEVCK